MIPAPPQTYLPEAVLFQFDDVAASVYDRAYPILDAADLPATCYAAENIVGGSRMTLAQYQDVYAAGWDVGNHTTTHADLTLVDAATQQARFEAMDAYLVANGMPRAAKHVAYPFGKSNADTLTAMAAAGMRTGRLVNHTDQTVPITEPYALRGLVSLYTTTTPLETAKGKLYSTTPGRIVIYLCHGISDAGEVDGTYAEADFAALVDYVKAKGCRVVTISQLWDYVQAGYVWP